MHDFADTTFADMVASGRALAPELGRAGELGVGETILAGVAATRRVAPANTNLGIVLLLAPLARAALMAGAQEAIGAALTRVLDGLDGDDATAAYAAIRLAAPGGLGESPEHDVRQPATVGLREAMAAAAHRDRIAAEYAAGFPIVLGAGVPLLASSLADGLARDDAIVDLQLRLLDRWPDTLIARKRGMGAAEEVSVWARAVLAAGGVRTAAGRAALAGFDARLRVDGNALNPGTTADLIAAILFVSALTGVLAIDEVGA